MQWTLNLDGILMESLSTNIKCCLIIYVERKVDFILDGLGSMKKFRPWTFSSSLDQFK